MHKSKVIAHPIWQVVVYPRSRNRRDKGHDDEEYVRQDKQQDDQSGSLERWIPAPTTVTLRVQ